MTDVAITQAPTAGGPPPLTKHVEHDSRLGELVPMHLKFLALTLLTLGVYQFWARTHARRFLWRQTTLLGDPFTYLGRPVELLVGFFVALVLIFGPILALNILLVTQAGPEMDPAMATLVGALAGIQAVGIPYLIFVGGYTARRYRLSRTAWRGIRGAQTGSAWKYGLHGYLGALAAGFTAGWYYPWQRARLARFRIGNSWFGSQRFDCNIVGGDLVGSFAIMWVGVPATFLVVAILGLGAGAAFVGLFGVEGEVADGEFEQQLQRFAWLLQLAGLLVYAPVGLFYLIYRALELRQVARHTTYADGAIRFEMTHTVWQYVRYALVNLLILLATLGTGWIYLNRRQLNFWSRHLVIVGGMDLSTLRQTAETGPRTGEGLAELFDLGFEVGF